jgi:membrane protein YqaA with SNARE-associated domain
METLNWGYLQLGLVALVFGGLQVWWIGSVFRKREQAKPLSEGEFRKALEQKQTLRRLETRPKKNVVSLLIVE